MPSQRFPRQERLKSRKMIRRIFSEGRSLHTYPVRIAWLKMPAAEVPMQAGFTVPRRTFRKAVTRNLLRRRMFEAYRKEKSALHALQEHRDFSIAAMFIYTGKDVMPYDEIATAMRKTLQKFLTDLSREKGKRD